MNNRKYISKGIKELEILFLDNSNDVSILKALQSELIYRKTKRAMALMADVQKKLRSFNNNLTIDSSTTSNTALISAALTSPDDKSDTVQNIEGNVSDVDWDQVFALSDAKRTGVVSLAQSSKPIESKPKDVLDTWTIIEALSPQTFKKPDDLVIGLGSVAPLNHDDLPWIRGESSRPNCKLFYTIYLGSIDLGASTDDLLKIYQDQREEIPNVSGQAALAAVIVDKNGFPLGLDGLAISSYGWAYSRALVGDLDTLQRWDIVEEKLLEGLSKIFDCRDEDDNLLPVDREIINNATEWLVTNCAIPV